MSCRQIQSGRVSIIAAALLVLLVAAELSIGSDDRHDRSYHAGYVAASHGSWVRDAMATRGMTSSTLCESVADRTLTGDEATEEADQDECGHVSASLPDCPRMGA